MIDKVVKENHCSNCAACLNLCPTNAIEIKETGVSVIDEKCVKCGACLKVCTYLNPPKASIIENCFAAWSNDNKILETSASSGIATSFATSIIQKKGIVCGTKYVDNRLIFYCTDKIEELKDFQGSKYVQSYNEKVFVSIRHFLQEGRHVLFVGTPCQVAGLKSFLGKEYELLLTIDLVCHGTSNQEHLRQYVDKILKGKEWKNILFRGKDGISLTVYGNNDEVVYKREKGYEPFYMAYAKGLISKEYCYSCQYAKMDRMGDVTVGDFWGLNKNSLKIEPPKNKQVSLVLINSEKGTRFFENLVNEGAIICEECNVSETLKFNRQLEEPIKEHLEREQFKFNIKKKGFNYALRKTKLYKRTNFNYLKLKIKRFLGIGEKL